MNTVNVQPVTTAASESTWSPIAISQEELRMTTAVTPVTTVTTVTNATAATPLIVTPSDPVADESEDPSDRTSLLVDSSAPSWRWNFQCLELE